MELEFHEVFCLFALLGIPLIMTCGVKMVSSGFDYLSVLVTTACFRGQLDHCYQAVTVTARVATYL